MCVMQMAAACTCNPTESAATAVAIMPPVLQLDLSSRTPESRTSDGWLQYTIPMRDFDCPEQAAMNQLLWEAKPGTSSGWGMCLDEAAINRPGAAPADAPAGPPASG